MRTAAALLFSLISSITFAATPAIPKNATVLEAEAVAENRTLVLWMLQPKKHPREDAEELYTCPEYTRGHYHSGRARVSLVDTSVGKVINTLDLGELDLPYKIAAGFYYHVPGAKEPQEGTPKILHLKDYNGDGDAAEFALFNAESCQGVGTTLIGYSRKTDKAVQYPVHLQITENGKRRTSVEKWVDSVFSTEPVSPGRWKFEIDYRGRAGTLDKYEVTYNREKERFEGTVTSTEDDD
jgi:hypothetical protein